MEEAQFDPNGFFQFDLEKGAIQTGQGERVLILSQSVLAPLIDTAVRSGDLTAIRELGNQLGDRVASTLGTSVDAASPSAVLGHAASVMALFGWGRLQLERWGDALVLEVEQLPPLDRENLAVAALLGGLFSTLSSAEVACVPVGTANQYLVVDPMVAERVWAWSKSGDPVPVIVSKLSASEES